MYKKCHNAIKDNAKNQNCKKLLKLIELAETVDLLFIYAYDRTFPASMNEPLKNIKYIELIDSILKNKFNIKATLIKNSKELLFLYEMHQNVIKFSYKEQKLFSERMEILKSFADKIKNFNMDELPKL